MKLVRITFGPAIIGFLIVVCGLLSLPDSVFADEQSPPVLKPERVVFANGSILEYRPYLELHSDAEVALAAGEPVWLTETPKLVNQWERVLLVKEVGYFEGTVKTLSIFDWSGTLRRKPISFIGNLFILEPVKRILLAQKSAHYLVEESYILNIEGEIVAKVSQPANVFDFSISHDGRFFWILSQHVENGRPFTRATFYDGDGHRLETTDTFVEREWILQVKGEKYRLYIERPDFPG